MSLVFDRSQVRRNRQLAFRSPDSAFFLSDLAAESLLVRLDDIKRSFPRVLLCGTRLSAPVLERFRARGGQELFVTMDLAGTPSVVADAEALPFAPGSFDAVLSLFDLQSVNDVPGALIQMRRCLRPDGVMLAVFPGGESLRPVRHALMEAELAVCGGASPRIHPTIPREQAASLMQRAGFTLPVVDSEMVRVAYSRARDLFADLRAMGEGNALLGRDRRFAGRTLFAEAERALRGPEGVEVTFELIHLIGWAGS